LEKSQNRTWNARGSKVTHSHCIITYTVVTGLRKIPVSLRPHLFSQAENTGRETIECVWKDITSYISLRTGHLRMLLTFGVTGTGDEP